MGPLTLDIALGGGLPKGRVIEIYGPESSGKTTLALHAIAEVQKSGGIAAFVDAEPRPRPPVTLQSLGVDIVNLLVFPTRYWRDGPGNRRSARPFRRR